MDSIIDLCTRICDQNNIVSRSNVRSELWPLEFTPSFRLSSLSPLRLGKWRRSCHTIPMFELTSRHSHISTTSGTMRNIFCPPALLSYCPIALSVTTIRASAWRSCTISLRLGKFSYLTYFFNAKRISRRPTPRFLAPGPQNDYSVVLYTYIHYFTANVNDISDFATSDYDFCDEDLFTFISRNILSLRFASFTWRESKLFLFKKYLYGKKKRNLRKFYARNTAQYSTTRQWLMKQFNYAYSR